jgi:hypothetical protein
MVFGRSPTGPNLIIRQTGTAIRIAVILMVFDEESGKWSIAGSREPDSALDRDCDFNTHFYLSLAG